GIFNAGGTLDVSNATIMNNVADGAAGSGGGILNDEGVLTVSATTISNNTSVRAGGGIEDNSIAGNMLLLDSVDFVDNMTSASPGNGGGLHITGEGDASITGGSATGNIAAAEGGALWNSVGIMTIDGMTIDGNEAQGADPDNGGGGVFNNGGTLTITNSTTITNNLATGASGSGGGLLSVDGDVSVTDITFDGNAANRAGGAIEIIDGTLSIVTSLLTNNDVNGTAGAANPGNGGALHVTGNAATVDIEESTIDSNSAASEGGGLWNQDGATMNVLTSTVSRNSANEGGGVYNNTGAITMIMRSTISSNDAAANGGGITNDGASLDLNAVTVGANTAGGTGGGIQSNTSTSLKNTLVALNTASSGTDVSGTFTSNDYNLIGTDDEGAFPEQANDIEEVDPMLGPLQNNGGTTETHELLVGSQAYNSGDPADLFDDQIGQSVFEGIRDIGAFEAQDILLDVEEISNNGSGVVVYPNPSYGEATIAIPQTFGTDIRVTVIELGSGKIVKDFTASTGNNQVQFNGMASGVYIIQVVSDGATSTHRLILAK
ncbi:choice-of-anchor Q domain-containing protein, partial [Marinirhabdus gelatinilytica]|uniref:choice-of-anchor Q domain-containing protein n=1 Tax=Marinirhabdus gelatinilytica TaxID=1703343 RepID=UPI0014764538